MKEITFNEYEEFIYMNTVRTVLEARRIARKCWNNGLDKYEALDFAARVTRRFIDGFGWALVDKDGNVVDRADTPEEENEDTEQAMWDVQHGFVGYDDDRH